MKGLLVTLAVGWVMGAQPSAKAKAAFDRGEAALAGQRLDDAQAAYQEAIADTPAYAEALNGLGSVLFKKGKKEEAMARFKAAIGADPGFKLAYFNLGYAARKSGDFKTAAQAYQKYVQLDPNDADGFYGLGESYAQIGETAKAIAAYEGFIDREKRPSEQKWIDKARAQIETLKSQAARPPPPPPAPVVAQRPVADAGVARQAPADAGAPAPVVIVPIPPRPAPPPVPPAPPQQAVAPPAPAPPAVSPQAALAAEKMAEGDRLFSAKKFREASFAYQDAANADPNSVEAYFKLGAAYASLGFFQQAIDRWNRVLQISKDPVVIRSTQENISRAQGRMGKAGGATAQTPPPAPPPAPTPPPAVVVKAPAPPPPIVPNRDLARKAYEEGLQKFSARNYNEALERLTTAIGHDPNFHEAYVARGSTYISLRHFQESAEDYLTALRLNSSYASPLYGLAEAYRGMGKAPEAKEYYRRYANSNAADARPDLKAEALRRAEKLP